MNHLLTVITLLVICADVRAQPPSPSTITATVPEEVRAFWSDVREAVQKKDRAALERVFAPEFIWVHAFGYTDDRATAIDQILKGILPLGGPRLDPPTQILLSPDAMVFRFPGAKTSDGAPAYSITVVVKRDGRYQFVHIQTSEMQPERQWITLPTATLDAYAGRYKGSIAVNVIKREGATLIAELPIGPVVLKPTSENVFFDRSGGEWTFHRGKDGKVTHYIRRFRGRENRIDRLD